MDTPNKYLVSGTEGLLRIVVGNPPHGSISKQDALLLAAWLVALADPGRERFEQVFKTVTET